MQELIEVNGEVFRAGEARISPFDRGFLLGDGVFEVLKVESGQFVFLGDHLDRLYTSLKEMGFALDFSRSELEERMKSLVKKSGCQKAYFRVTVTGGTSLGFSVDRKALKPNVYLFVKPLENFSLKPLSLKFVHSSYKDSSRRLKTNNYSLTLRELALAKKEGFDDILWVNGEKELQEASAANVFFARGKKVFTPHSSSGLLEGVTRKNLLSFLSENGFQSSDKTLLKEDLKNFEVCFLTSSIKGLVPVSSISSFSFPLSSHFVDSVSPSFKKFSFHRH